MIDFLRYQYLCFFVSIALLFTGIGFYFSRGGFSYNIDFVGGAEVRLEFDQAFDTQELRKSLEAEDVKDFLVQNVSGDKEFIVRLANQGDVENLVVSSIKKMHPDVDFKVRSVDQVGPEASKTVTTNAILAIFLVMILLLLYISIRHKFAYAVGAIAALAHDLLVLLTFYLVFDFPISLNILTAVLTVLGYSLNDTIVVFSRIQDNIRFKKMMSTAGIVNLSINQTLSRTILTSFTTFISVFSLYLFGGDLFKSFSITMMIAVVVGTYSSIYIASPVMLFFNKRKVVETQ